MEDLPEGEEDDQFELPPEERGPELLQACKDNNTGVAKELIKLGAPVLSSIQKGGWSTLHFASLNGNEDLVKALLAAGAAERYKMLKAKTINETSPMTKDVVLTNSPLQWSAYHGHINVCWFLLGAGYDVDDTDLLGNTALHLAATNNHHAIVQLLLRSGADPLLRNIYNHAPLDLATDNKTRSILRKAEADLASNDNTAESRKNQKEAMRQANLQIFKAAEDKLEQFFNSSSFGNNSEENAEKIRLLEQAIHHGEEIKVSSDLLTKAHVQLKRWKAAQKLFHQMEKIEAVSPIITQGQYCEFVNKLEALVIQAKGQGVEGSILEQATSVVSKSHSEYWLNKSQDPLLKVTRADATHAEEMLNLENHIKSAQSAGANEELVGNAVVLLNRLQCELNLRKALDDFPTVRIPIPDQPKDYWQAEDVGKVQETEGFPQPPPEGQYRWIHSESYVRFKLAQAGLKYAIEEAEKYNCNGELVGEAKAKDKAIQPIRQALEAKDDADKTQAIAILTKSSTKRRSSAGGGAGGKKKGGK